MSVKWSELAEVFVEPVRLFAFVAFIVCLSEILAAFYQVNIDQG